MSAGVFLYYFPGNLTERDVTREWLRSSPIAEPMRDIWERAEGFKLRNVTVVNNGPEGRGIIFAAVNDPEQSPQPIGYYKDHQRWTKCGSYWLGIDDRYPPNAVSLERRKVVKGLETELATGGVWLLPIIREPDPTTLRPTISNLPLVRTSGASGPAIAMPDRYQAIWDMTGKLFDWRMWGVLPAEPEKMSEFVYNAAAFCLGVNYRVGPHELDLLKCLEEDDVVAIISAAIDMVGVQEIIAERNRGNTANPTEAPGSLSSQPGREGFDRITDHQGVSCA